MRNIMYFGEKNSREMKVVVTQLPAITGAESRGEWLDIAGRHGSAFVSDNAMNAVDMSVSLYVYPEADPNAVIEWLSGEGDLRFNDWGWFWKAARTAAFTMTPCTMNDGWYASVTFKVQPHRYLWPEAADIVLTSPTVLQNPCSGESAPIITVNGSGDIDLMVGSSTVMIDGLNGNIEIDCDSKTAFINGDMANTSIHMVGDWPAIETPTCGINWSGNVTSVTIRPRYRYK